MRSPLALAALTLALALAAAAPALADGAAPVTSGAAPAAEEPAPAQWGRGPFEVRDPYLLALSRLSPWARSPEVLGHGQVEVGLRGVWTNTYGIAANRFVIDGEMRQVIAAVRIGLLDRLELDLDLPYEWRGGGVLDGFIEGFHSAFGIPDMDRDDRPRDHYLVQGLERDGTPYSLDHQGAGLGDLILGARGLLTAGGPRLPAVTASLRLRLPTGRPKFQLSDGVDVSLGLDASKRLGALPLVVSAHVFYTYYAQGRVDGLEVERHRGFFGLGLEWELLPRLSLVVHGWVETPRERKAFDDPAPPFPQADLMFGNYVTYIAAGFKAEPIDGLSVEVGMLEDVIDPETTADFGLLGNLSYRF